VLKAKKTPVKGNLENNLRNARYTFFEKMRLKHDCDLIAVAHNQDDQAETVLMRIIRGSGLNGLSAMKAVSGKIIRPLLQTSKKDILSYVKEKKLKYRTDKSNSDKSFTRNKIRHDLLPYLERKFNPRIKKTLSEWSLSVADDYDYIEKSAESFVGAVCKNKCAHFSVKELSALPLSLQRQALRDIFGVLKAGTMDLENQQIAEMLKVMKSDKSKSQKAIVGGLKILKKGGRIEIFC
jgi:tRNA(Ile)-lysidine synthase